MAKKKKKEDEFPGYPQYPANEDIMSTGNRANEVDLNMDDVTRSYRHNSELPPAKNKGGKKGEEEQEETWQKDKTGEDLDVPGADLDDAEEAIGEEDEENNLYSLGGDRHRDLEEDNGEFLDEDEDSKY
ncbi:hypothetical protein [Chitinophaga vietnamensis]|uniref:hypothetical protein n=1 Tax=Chitinophaga vietnamensis TaxID=2593957 RepID=UPI001178B519|nr:hypothetical protein [Chitinophaga vietnamensis]